MLTGGLGVRNILTAIADSYFDGLIRHVHGAMFYAPPTQPGPGSCSLQQLSVNPLAAQVVFIVALKIHQPGGLHVDDAGSH